MASTLKDYLQGKGRIKHGVGNVTSFAPIRTITNGVIMTENVDNYALVEVEYVDGVAKAKYATASATALNTFLMVTPEEVLDTYGEKASDFYNGKDERATPAYLDRGLTFTTTLFEGFASATVGKMVVWDATKKKYEVKETPDESDIHVFQIISLESDERYVVDGLETVELAVVR